MHSLRASEIEETTRVLGPFLTMSQVFEAMRREDETIRLIDEWNAENG